MSRPGKITFRGFPAINGWIQQTKQSARAKGYIETILGCRRYLPRLLASSDARVERKARAEREAINTVVHSSAADVMTWLSYSSFGAINPPLTWSKRAKTHAARCQSCIPA